MRNSVITVVLFVVGMVGACATVWYGMAREASGMEKELVTTVFQFFVIVVLGGCISFVHQLLTQQREDRERAKNLRRERRAEEKQLLLNTYNEFLGAYDKAKRARRILRARVLRPESEGIPPRDQEVLASTSP